MKKKLFLMAFVVITCTILLASCNSKKVQPTTADLASSVSPDYLNVGVIVDSKTWDPGLNTAGDGGLLIKHLDEGLLKEDASGQYVPAGAESVSASTDNMTYTIKLRKDAVWSDGKPVTANDYKFAWLRVLDPKNANEYAFIMAPYIKGADAYNKGTGSKDDVAINVIDDYNFTVTLGTPCPFFEQLLAFYVYYPVREDVVSKGDGWEKDPKTFVGNGAFVLEDYNPGALIKMKKSDTYWNKANIHYSGINFKIIPDTNTLLNAYKSKDLDVAIAVPAQEIPHLLATDPDFSSVPKIGTVYVNFNCDKPPFDNVNVRKAFALAIDRTSITTNVLQNGEKPAKGIMPPALKYSDGTYGLDNYLLKDTADVTLAKKYLADGGFPDGKNFPAVTYLYNTSDDGKALAESLQSMWKDNLGIDVKLANEEWTVFLSDRTNGNYQISFGRWIGDYADPSTMLDLFGGDSGNNSPQWKPTITSPTDLVANPEAQQYNDDIKKYQALPNGPDRDAAFKDAEDQLINKYMVVSPVYFLTTYNYYNHTKLNGVQYSALNGYDFNNVTFTK